MKLFERFKGKGVARFLHQCGNISDQLHLYPSTPKPEPSASPAGVNLGEVYRTYARRAVTAGNVDVIKTLFGVCEAVSECIATIPDPHRKFMLMPSCDLPDTSLKNVKTFPACADRV